MVSAIRKFSLLSAIAAGFILSAPAAQAHDAYVHPGQVIIRGIAYALYDLTAQNYFGPGYYFDRGYYFYVRDRAHWRYHRHNIRRYKSFNYHRQHGYQWHRPQGRAYGYYGNPPRRGNFYRGPGRWRGDHRWKDHDRRKWADRDDRRRGRDWDRHDRRDRRDWDRGDRGRSHDGRRDRRDRRDGSGRRAHNN